MWSFFSSFYSFWRPASALLLPLLISPDLGLTKNWRLLRQNSCLCKVNIFSTRLGTTASLVEYFSRRYSEEGKMINQKLTILQALSDKTSCLWIKCFILWCGHSSRLSIHFEDPPRHYCFPCWIFLQTLQRGRKKDVPKLMILQAFSGETSCL